MKRLLYIPYYYWYRGTVIRKQIVKRGEEIDTVIKIHFKLDFFTYETINLSFNMKDTIIKDIDKIIKLTIDKLIEKFRG